MKKDVFLTPTLYLPVLFTFRVTIVIAVGVALAIAGTKLITVFVVVVVSIAIGMAVCPIVTTAMRHPTELNQPPIF